MNNFKKSSEFFSAQIQKYLQQRAEQDSQFAEKFSNPNKSIEDCVNFIYNSVMKSGCCGFTDAEVFCMAVHYYDEDFTKVNLDDQFKSMDLDASRIICNCEVRLSEDELKQIEEAAKVEAEEKVKKDAFDKAYREAEKKYTKKPTTAAPKQEEQQPQLDLFGGDF